MSIDFMCKIYIISTVHGDITVCMLGYYNNIFIQASFVFLDPMTSCHSLQHFDRPIIDDPKIACSKHCYLVAVEQFRPNCLL